MHTRSYAKEVAPAMCYTSRDYSSEQEARQAREEARKRLEAIEEAERSTEKAAPKKRDREPVRT